MVGIAVNTEYLFLLTASTILSTLNGPIISTFAPIHNGQERELIIP